MSKDQGQTDRERVEQAAAEILAALSRQGTGATTEPQERKPVDQDYGGPIRNAFGEGFRAGRDSQPTLTDGAYEGARIEDDAWEDSRTRAGLCSGRETEDRDYGLRDRSEAWMKVFALCRELGMGFDSYERTGEERVLNFIRSLAPPADTDGEDAKVQPIKCPTCGAADWFLIDSGPVCNSCGSPLIPAPTGHTGEGT